MSYLAGAVGGLVAALILIPTGDATPITYDFTVTATSGPLDGDVADGTFTFDSSIIPLGGGVEDGPLTALSFAWDGIAYNQTTANTGYLDFDSTGTLITAVFGNDCVPGVCETYAGENQWNVLLGSPSTFPSAFYYSALNESYIHSGTASYFLVPEPSMTALLLIALGGFLLASARCLRSSAPTR
jgi:hypothetical protein